MRSIVVVCGYISALKYTVINVIFISFIIYYNPCLSFSPVVANIQILMHLCTFSSDRKWSLSITVTGSQVGGISDGSLIWENIKDVEHPRGDHTQLLELSYHFLIFSLSNHYKKRNIPIKCIVFLLKGIHGRN